MQPGLHSENLSQEAKSRLARWLSQVKELATKPDDRLMAHPSPFTQNKYIKM